MLKEYLSNLANRFRIILGTTEPINAQDFEGEIENVFNKGHSTGLIIGRQEGYNSGYEQGKGEGYEQGKAEGVTEGKPLGKIELLQDSEYMNAKVNGTAIAVNDVNAVEHIVACSVSSKNLLDPYAYTLSTNTDGVVSINYNGCVLLNGGMDTGIEITYTFTTTEECVLSLTGVAYGTNVYYDNQFIGAIEANSLEYQIAVGTHTLRLVQASQSFNDLYIQLEKGTTPTPYTPYLTDFSGIEVSRYGKNLFRPQFDFIFAEANYTDGTLFTPQISGNTIACVTNPLYVPQNTWLYYKHALLLGKDRIVIRIYNSNGENISTKEQTDIICSSTWYLAAYKGYIVDKPASGFSFKVTSNVAYITLCYCGMNIEGGNKYGNLQLELGTTATPYEPYIEPTVHTANADGTVDGIKSISPNMTLLTNNNGVVINANYLRDIDTYIENLITDVALSGGEA